MTDHAFPSDLEAALRNAFDEELYGEANPDVRRAVLRGDLRSGFDHFVAYGAAEGRRFGTIALADPPLAFAPLLAHAGLTAEAIRLYRACLPYPGVERPVFARFALYTWEGARLLAHEQRCLRPEAAVARAVPALDSQALWRLVLLHHAVATGAATADHLAQLFALSAALPGPAIGFALAAIVWAAERLRCRLNFAEILATLLDSGCFEALPVLAALAARAETEAPDARDLILLHRLRYGDLAGLATLVEGADTPSGFQRLLQMLADLEIVEATPMPSRAVRCAENIHRIVGNLAALDSYQQRSVLIRYVNARLKSLMGNHDAAEHIFFQLAGQREMFPHLEAMAAENLLLAGRPADALAIYQERHVETVVPELAGQIAMLRHWLDHDADLLTWHDSIGDAPFAGPPEFASSPDQQRLYGAVIADHDFVLLLRIAAPESAPQRIELLRSGADRGLAVRLQGGRLRLALGDGARWLFEAEIASIAPGAEQLVEIRRTGSSLLVRQNGGVVFTLSLPQRYWLRGDTLILHPAGAGQRDVRVGLRLAIGKYPPAGASRPDIVFTSLFWGGDFARMFNDCLVPSLLQLGGLPEIARERPTRFEIHAPAEDAAMLSAGLRQLRGLGIEILVRTDLFADAPDLNAALLGQVLQAVWTQHEAEGAITVMAQPDHVFGTGLPALLRAFQPNDYVVAGHPRIAKETGLLAIAAALAGGAVRSNADLVRLAAVAYPHVSFRTGLAAPEGWLRAERHAGGFTVRFKEPPPLVLQVRKDCLAILDASVNLPKFEQIDHEVVDLMARQGRLKLVDDSRTFFWAEFSSDRKNIPTVRNAYWSKTARLLSQLPLQWHL